MLTFRRCPRPNCGGSLLWDRDNHEFVCFACNRPVRAVEPDSEKKTPPRPQQKLTSPPAVSPGPVVSRETEEYVPSYRIRFSRDQVMFLLRHLDLLRQGIYLSDHTGYVDIPSGRKKRRRRAPFVLAAEVAAELDWRLSRTGLNRYLVEDVITNGLLEEIVASKVNLPVEEVNLRVRSVIAFCCGFKRKKSSYSAWKQTWKYRYTRPTAEGIDQTR